MFAKYRNDKFIIKWIKTNSTIWKYKQDLIKALSKPKSKPKIGINKKKLEEIRKDFYKLKHKFSEADNYRNVFYDVKNYRHLSES